MANGGLMVIEFMSMAATTSMNMVKYSNYLMRTAGGFARPSLVPISILIRTCRVPDPGLCFAGLHFRLNTLTLLSI